MMVDDTMGEAIRAGERAVLRARVQALRRPDPDCAIEDCYVCPFNDALAAVLDLLDHPTPKTTP